MMRSRYRPWLTAIAVLLVTAAVVAVLLPTGPQIDPQKVVRLQDFTFFASPILIYNYPDNNGWPSARRERAYLRFLQDHGVKIAFLEKENGDHHALVGPVDSFRIRGLYDSAKSAGIKVPEFAIGSRFED